MNSGLYSFTSSEELSIAATDYVFSLANQSISERGVFRIALAGGSTPRRLYEMLSSNSGRTNWSKWAVYFSDERIVPLTDGSSNFAMTKAALLSKVPISGDNTYVPNVALKDPQLIAEAYEKTIRDSTNEKLPAFDLILLGLGSDGHTASLFPGKTAADEKDRLVVASPPGVLPPPVDRVTFTPPLINAAKNVLFLVTGTDKAKAFKAAYEGTSLGDVKTVPASLVRPANGTLRWFVTREIME
jgi:6-phosphogluconolactonase